MKMQIYADFEECRITFKVLKIPRRIVSAMMTDIVKFGGELKETRTFVVRPSVLEPLVRELERKYQIKFTKIISQRVD